MGRDLILALALKATGGLGWLLLVAVLSQRLEAEPLGRALYILALVPLLGGLASAGWSQSALRTGPALFAAGARRGLLRLLAGALASAAAAALLAGGGAYLLQRGGAFPLLPGAAFLLLSVFLLAAGNLAGALLRAAGQVVLPLLATGPLRVLPVLALGLGPAPVSEAALRAAFLLALALGGAVQAVALAAVLLRLRPPAETAPPPPPSQPLRQWGGGVAATLFQNLDLLALGLFLNPAGAAGYLVARRLAGVLSLAADGCRAVLAPRLARAFDSGRQGFAALAGESGRLILTGGLVLAALVLLTGVLVLQDRRLLILLLLAQMTPALFGFTGMMMAMSALQGARLRLLLPAILLAFPAMALAALAGPGALALVVALTHLGFGAVSARLLWRAYRVRPPLLSPFRRVQKTKSSWEKSSGRIGVPSLLSTRRRSAPKRISAP